MSEKKRNQATTESSMLGNAYIFTEQSANVTV